ncbi:MAG: hypothetical protein ABI672_00890 [Vicinamibacteria bacterium]
MKTIVRAGISLAVVVSSAGLSFADNLTPATARSIALNSISRKQFPAVNASDAWWKVTLFANRSYQISSWTSTSDGSNGCVSVALFSDAAGTVVAPSTQYQSTLEGSPNDPVTIDPETEVINVTTTGEYRIKLTTCDASGQDLNLMVRETTLFSPWFFVTPAYDSYQTIHNNTSSPVSVTLRATDATGTLVGTALTFTVPANATVFKSTKIDMLVPGTGNGSFGGTTLTHNGAFGAISANTTTLGSTGLSFDSPFTTRDAIVLGSPIR